VKVFLAQARDARQFWLHEYESTSGNPVFVGGNRLHPNQVYTLPFQSKRALTAPLIQVSGRKEKQYLALLDPSSKESWIALETAFTLGAIPIGPPPHALQPIHVQDRSRGILTVINKLKFGELHMEDTLFYARLTDKGLGPLTRENFRWKPQLILGYDLLSAFRYVQFDFPNRSITLSSTLPYSPDPNQLIATTKLHKIGGVLAVDGLIDEYAGPIILDFGGNYHIASTKPDTEYAQHVSLGDLVFRYVPAAPLSVLGLGYPTYPRIGRQLLSRFNITIDNKREVVYFERPGKKRFL
jgi:hypothetical protein